MCSVHWRRRYRGAAPVQRALCDGVNETGVSLAFTVLQCDAGPVLAQQSVQVSGCPSRYLACGNAAGGITAGEVLLVVVLLVGVLSKVIGRKGIAVGVFHDSFKEGGAPAWRECLAPPI